MTKTIKKGESFYFGNEPGTIYICVDFVYRPDAVTVKTYVTALQGKLYPIYISANASKKAIVINQKIKP